METSFHHAVFYLNRQAPRSRIKNKNWSNSFPITYANVWQRICADTEIGLKTAGGAQDTDSDTNWKRKGVKGREEEIP